MTQKMTQKMTKKMTEKMTEKNGKFHAKSDNTFIGPVEGFFDDFWGHFLPQKVRTKFHRRVKKKNFANFKKMLLT
jgi:hypothetical protein